MITAIAASCALSALTIFAIAAHSTIAPPAVAIATSAAPSEEVVIRTALALASPSPRSASRSLIRRDPIEAQLVAGTFLTPQATIGTQIKSASGILTPSLRVAYTHLAMDSYAETGSLANMTVAARTVSTLDLRGQVAFAIKPIVTATGQIDATMRLGADATFTNSDDITATVLSQPLTFSTTQDTALRGFAGLDLAQAMDNGAKLNLSVEAGYGSNSAVTLQGTAGMVWAF